MKAQSILTRLTVALLLATIAALPAMGDASSFYPTDDAWIDEYTAGDCWGAYPYMGVRNKSNGGWEANSLVRFDVSSVPPGTQIASATLHLYYSHHLDCSPTGRPLTCYRVTGDWDEETVTWNTRPSWTSGPTSAATVPSSPQWMQWDVTDDVQAFVDGKEEDYGWVIEDQTYWEGGNIPFMFFPTKEYADAGYTPYLEVVPEPGAAALLVVLGAVAFVLRRR